MYRLCRCCTILLVVILTACTQIFGLFRCVRIVSCSLLDVLVAACPDQVLLKEPVCLAFDIWFASDNSFDVRRGGVISGGHAVPWLMFHVGYGVDNSFFVRWASFWGQAVALMWVAVPLGTIALSEVIVLVGAENICVVKEICVWGKPEQLGQTLASLNTQHMWQPVAWYMMLVRQSTNSRFDAMLVHVGADNCLQQLGNRIVR